MGNVMNCDCFQHPNANLNLQNLMFRPQPPTNRSQLEKQHLYHQPTRSSVQNQPSQLFYKVKTEEDSVLAIQPEAPFYAVFYPKCYEIYLTVDEKWCRIVQNSLQLPMKMEDVYTQLSNNKSPDQLVSKKIVRRSAYDNKKVQILFKQHIPMIGKYFFQVELLSYLPKKRCDFTIGIVNYQFAKDKLHCRDSMYQQSYTFIERRINMDERLGVVPIQLNLKFKVEVNRQEQQVAFFINEKLEKKQRFKTNLQEALLLAPYIQTQYEGVVFSWKTVASRLGISYRILSTIGEEASSIVSY